MKSLTRALLIVATVVVATQPSILMAAQSEFLLTIRDHRFEPDTLEVPADQKIRLRVKNADTTPEEFESHELDREKVIPGGQEAVILIGPLDPGTYTFVGEFHEDTAKGKLVVR